MENNKIIKYEGGLVQHVGNAVNITSKLLSVNLRALKITHLDDHTLYAKGVSNCILKKFPNAIIKHFQDGDKALEYVTYCLNGNEKLDLIITDMKHPGLNGIDFSKAVRKMALVYKQKIPILFIDVYYDEFWIQKVKELGLSKLLYSGGASCEEINLAVSNFI